MILILFEAPEKLTDAHQRDEFGHVASVLKNVVPQRGVGATRATQMRLDDLPEKSGCERHIRVAGLFGQQLRLRERDSESAMMLLAVLEHGSEVWIHGFKDSADDRMVEPFAGPRRLACTSQMQADERRRQKRRGEERRGEKRNEERRAQHRTAEVST